MTKLLSILLLCLLSGRVAKANEVSDLAYKQVYSSSEAAAHYSTSALAATLREVKSEAERQLTLTKFCFNIGGLMEVSRTVSQLAAFDSPVSSDDSLLRKEISSALDEKTRQAVGVLAKLSYLYLTKYDSAAGFCETRGVSPAVDNPTNALGLAPEEFQNLVKILKETMQAAYDVKHAVEAGAPKTAVANPWAQDRK